MKKSSLAANNRETDEEEDEDKETESKGGIVKDIILFFKFKKYYIYQKLELPKNLDAVWASSLTILYLDASSTVFSRLIPSSLPSMLRA